MGAVFGGGRKVHFDFLLNGHGTILMNRFNFIRVMGIMPVLGPTDNKTFHLVL